MIRVPHSSGMLEGHYTADTVFPANDHRRHRPHSWLINGVKKVEQLRFLERPDRTLGQAAIQWLLAEPRVMSVLPNIYDRDQLVEFAGASDAPPLTADEIARVERALRKQLRLGARGHELQGHDDARRGVRMSESIFTPDAPAPIGPYSQAILSGGDLYCSGQIPLDPATGDIVGGDISIQTERVLQSLGNVLHAAGFGFEDVVKTTHLPERYERFCRGQRGLRKILRRIETGSVDLRCGRLAERRPHRNRLHRKTLASF